MFVPYKVHQSNPLMIPNASAQRAPLLYSPLSFSQEAESRNGVEHEEVGTQVLKESVINADHAEEQVHREGEQVTEEENSSNRS